jgi:hypothetical protein
MQNSDAKSRRGNTKLWLIVVAGNGKDCENLEEHGSGGMTKRQSIEAPRSSRKLSPRALIAARVILLTGRFTLLCTGKLASFGKLVTFDFAGASPVGNFS